MKLCLFGGTFDPIHIGHLIMAQSVINTDFTIDKIVFIPAADPPHKDTAQYSDFDHRYNMISESIKDRDCFEISDIENRFKGESFTIKTVNYYKNEYNLDKDDLFLLIGEDSLVNFHTWKKPKDIIEQTTLLTITRPGFNRNKAKDIFRNNAKFINSPEMRISSTLIRNYVQKNKSLRYLVPDSVRTYINSHELYAQG